MEYQVKMESHPYVKTAIFTDSIQRGQAAIMVAMNTGSVNGKDDEEDPLKQSLGENIDLLSRTTAGC